MNWRRSTNDSLGNSRQCQTLDAGVPYRYYAPGRLALDEARERMQAEAVLNRLLIETEPIAGRPPLAERVRHRLGGILILIGTHLQGPDAVKTRVPTSGLGSRVA